MHRGDKMEKKKVMWLWDSWLNFNFNTTLLLVLAVLFGQVVWNKTPLKWN